MLSIVYIFVCEGIKKENGKISALNIFDKRTISDTPTVLKEDMMLAFGLLGEESDHDNEFTLRVRGKELDFSMPVTYKFNGYDEINTYTTRVSNFPVSEEQIVYFEIQYKSKLIGKYPLKFEVKEG